MVEDQAWVERLLQRERQNFEDVAKTCAELLEHLAGGDANLTGPQLRSLEKVLDSLEAPGIRNIAGISSAERPVQTGESSDRTSES